MNVDEMNVSESVLKSPPQRTVSNTGATELTPEIKLSKLFENVFQLTLDSNYSHTTNKFVFIGEDEQPDKLLKQENLDEVLLQRLMLTDTNQLAERVRPSPSQSANKNSRLELACLEPCQFQYLFASYKRLGNLRRHFVDLDRLNQFEQTTNLIINICRTILNIFEPINQDELNAIMNQSMQTKDSNLFISNKDQEYYLIKNNPQALSDLSIQLVMLIVDNFETDSGTLEQFFDKFMGSFEEQDSVKSILSNPDFTNIQINTIEQLVALFQIDECEMRFLNNMFLLFNKYFLKLNHCDDYTTKYLKNLDLLKFMTRGKLGKYLFLFNSFLGETSAALPTSGRLWQTETLIGKLLTPHALPIPMPLKQQPIAAPLHANPLMAALQQHQQGLQAVQLSVEYRYFSNPTQQTKRDIESNENSIWQIQSLVRKAQQSFFFEHLIRKNSNRLIRDTWLKWLGKCMYANKAKTQEWLGYMQASMHSNNTEHLGKFASDGFLLNLLDLLLEYSMPFCATPYCNKLLKINFNYSIAKSVNVEGLDKETKIIALNEKQQEPPARLPPIEFNFITECFYLTQNCMRLSYVSLYQKLMKLNGELSRWQSTYQQLMENSMMTSSDPNMARLKTHYESMTCEFLNVKSALLEPELLSKLVKFVCSTSSWLVYLAVFADANYDTANELKQIEDTLLIRKPTEKLNLNILAKIPEYFITNVVEFLIFLHRFKDSDIVDLFVGNNSTNPNDFSNLNSIISLILVFMGSPDRLFNPHCRASLVEAIEIILPKKTTGNEQYDGFKRKSLAYYVFAKHPCASYLTEALLNVFVSIEMTGQSVQFEQKFNYRRPMYELLEFLWNMPVAYSSGTSSSYGVDNEFDKKLLNQHRVKIGQLANEAFDNLSSSEQPLFLKFLNFLINDANFLLLEGLLYLEKIKTLQEKLDADKQTDFSMGGNNAPTPQQQQQAQQLRSEQEANLKHMIMLAKFHNFMSTKTIQTIKMLTSQIKSIFCDEVLVDRIATMLNDFMLHLVGKKRRQFKVKNLQEVEFHPKEILADICDIYMNLGSEESFCKAVSRDGRSYSAELFMLAKDVLAMIGRDYDYILNFTKLAEKIEDINRLQQMEELNFDDAPDEFLDPIMSQLMNDPVILPNSRTVVDRSTIARHLLSDQSDPFNRSPLTLQDVIPDNNLKMKIDEWKANKRKQAIEKPN